MYWFSCVVILALISPVISLRCWYKRSNLFFPLVAAVPREQLTFVVLLTEPAILQNFRAAFVFTELDLEFSKHSCLWRAEICTAFHFWKDGLYFRSGGLLLIQNNMSKHSRTWRIKANTHGEICQEGLSIALKPAGLHHKPQQEAAFNEIFLRVHTRDIKDFIDIVLIRSKRKTFF